MEVTTTETSAEEKLHPKELGSLLGAVARIRVRDGAAVWLFDLVRPEDPALVELLPRTHELSSRTELPAAFKADWMSSLRAGWTFEELSRALVAAGLDLHRVTANYSQLHWREPVASRPRNTVLWQGPVPRPSDLERANKMAQALGWSL